MTSQFQFLKETLLSWIGLLQYPRRGIESITAHLTMGLMPYFSFTLCTNEGYGSFLPVVSHGNMSLKCYTLLWLVQCKKNLMIDELFGHVSVYTHVSTLSVIYSIRSLKMLRILKYILGKSLLRKICQQIRISSHLL